ncbi:MAG TPA: hypothetical protein VNY05_15710 [Candidatus Acidoferrales bacterium]|nr:hypothetical protein [Candidatus Acidoferrales bacterium]
MSPKAGGQGPGARGQGALHAARRPACSRRQFLAFGWLPFLQPRRIRLAGASFRIVRNGHATRRYLLIHGNEETARGVLTRHMETHEGIAYLVENHTRNVTVDSARDLARDSARDSAQLDPNRMFSRVGAEANLKRLNPGLAPERLQAALNLLDRGRERLVRALVPPKGGLLVALHNNSETYSVMDEVEISDQTSLREPGDPHAFFLCTDPMDFAVLKTSPYNVVLQQHAPKQDDGSLSRLAAARGVRYVNLEVGLGNADRQQEMMRWLSAIGDQPSAFSKTAAPSAGVRWLSF